MTTMFNHNVIDFEVEKVPLYAYDKEELRFHQPIPKEIGSLIPGA